MVTRAKTRPTECVQIRGEDVLLRKGLGRCRKQRYALIVEFNILAWAEAAIAVPNSPKPIASEASGGSDYGHAPSSPAPRVARE